MTKPYDTAKLLTGRRFTVNPQGVIETLTRRYQVLRQPRSTIETLEVPEVPGLPQLGDAHPSNENLKVTGFSYSEDDNGLRWVVEVTYTLVNSPGWGIGGGNEAGIAEVSRDWDTQDVNIDLTHDASTGEPVLNAARDPFESVPQVPVACPVFKLVRKENTFPSARIKLSGTLNSAAGTLDGIAVPKRCGRMSVSCRRLYDDPDGYLFEYTYTVTIMSKIVDGTDIGWDYAFLQAGRYYLDEKGKRKQAMETDEETLQLRPRTIPALLNEDGTLNESGEPVNKVVASMPEASWGGIF